MNLTRLLDLDKKLLIKVAAGVVILVVALIFYLVKESTAEQDLTYSKISEIHAESIQTITEPAIMEAVAQEITMIVIDISGAVINPSVVELPDGSRVYEAIEKAGGLSKDADTTILNQAEILADGQKVYIPTKQEIEEISSKGNSALILPSTIKSGRQELININTASTEMLQQLSGIGPATADKIISYRNENGKFNRIEDIKNVSGIGEKTYDRFKDKITI
ncbi:MAG: helix-hairpin-helix domain-containing protein [Eubacteriales bacterium]|nr:helix-hairpin-helix domain-containing protein [Eubacteriales bacterium]